MTFSIMPSSYKSAAVSFIISAASFAFLESFHSIDAKPSGESIEYMEFSIIHTSLATPSASAPPLPPSPVTIDNTGTVRLLISYRFFAIASPWPRSSAPRPQYAPGVSIKHITGLLNFSACFISLSAFLYPSGLGIPKFLDIFSLVVLPFICPMTVTGMPPNVAIPPIIALSSQKFLSP